ncbi:hypothetical protein CTRI78_v008636 [Colletotrichum trifolii]|uniref:Uncharacterized protein n=1 Tax=Colletotrichum trifolii TaxID=5466 RepID=A0A4R8QT86_COLTR|nr:hypothetical protein CTRI78_v008636 [Colletotrichum trifolii]
MKIVERNKKWKLEIDSEQGHLSAEHTKLTEWSWNGPSKFEGQSYTHHGGDETMEYTVLTDTWRYCKTPMKDEDMAKRQSFYSMDDSSDDGQEDFGDADDDEGDTGFDEEDEFEDDDDGADTEENTEENTDEEDENTEPGGQR